MRGSLHLGPIVSGTAEPGIALTLNIDGDAERSAVVAKNGAWSFDLGDLGPGTYALGFLQATALGVYLPVTAALTVEA